MCGIAGLLSSKAPAGASPARLAALMAETLVHRGPDDSGAWEDPEAGVGLAHRRLSILDLSPAGRQPAMSPSGRFVVSFNGEIYNFRDLRPEGNDALYSSDTAALLAAFDTWGVSAATRRFAGMFAFAVWDRATRQLTLGRDRLGKKPLYFGNAGRDLVFASELKALRSHPAFSAELDQEAVDAFLRYACIPAPMSIYRDARKVPPGTLVTFDSTGRELSRETYWSVAGAFEAALADPFTGSPEEALNEIARLLNTAVGQRLQSDVPLGALLSGGIDSSLIAAVAHERSASPLKTFSIGFAESDFDESARARAVAEHLGTVHTELRATPEAALNLIPDLSRVYDEPFADSSQIPTLLVSKLAREHVTVALTGDGGDEVFGGYNRHIAAAGLIGRAARWPAPMRSAATTLLRLPSAKAIDTLLARTGLPQPADKLRKVADFLGRSDPSGGFEALRSIWPDPSEILVRGERRPTPDALLGGPSVPLAWRMMASDLAGYLPDDVLTKVDRASMAASLEVRSPLLDHRLVEFALRLPVSMKISGRRGKLPLRSLLARRVPPAVLAGPKRGFAVPLAAWLRGPLRDWAETLLSDKSIRDASLFNPGHVRAIWREHQSGLRNHQDRLWCVLILQEWAHQSN